MLADWYAPAERGRLLEGLAELDRRSRARSGDDFAGHSEADQVALLTAIDGEVDALRRAPATNNAHGRCPACGTPCAGVFDGAPGPWGWKRGAVRLNAEAG